LRNEVQQSQSQELAFQIAEDFRTFLDVYHGSPEVWDSQLDAQIHVWYAEELVKRKYFDFKSQPYFSPSSANSDKRELYEKIRGAKRDEQDKPPHQKRWTSLGTAIGDMIQRDILFAEKHYEKLTGKSPMFKFERREDGRPMFEDFAKKMHVIEHKGKRFSLFGTCDGIMQYTAEDGEVIRVGLEIKSKQTTAAQTSDYSMKGPKEDHVKQVTCYALMYDLDYYVILYVNASKKAWEMTPEEYEKNPDFRVFGLAITEEDKREVLDYFADVLEAVEIGSPPALDLTKFTFNNYKTACALSLSEEEFPQVEATAKQVLKSRLPDWKKQSYYDAYEFIKAVRNA
jgi:hypothetical protein